MLYEVMLEHPGLPILGDDDEPTGRNHYRRMVCDVDSKTEARSLAHEREELDENGEPTGYEIVSVVKLK